MTNMNQLNSTETDPLTTSWLDRPILSALPKIKIEAVLIAVVILLAVISRFYIVDLRVMSHDEVNHVVPAFDLYQGRGYRHDPVTHGPFQFHLLALSYFLLGDSDFSARVPSVLFSIATVVFVIFGFRRYLGKIGALLAGVFFLISPYMLFYGRYTRNESFVALFGVITLYAILRYLDKGENSALYLLTAAISLHFATKETAFIYVAQLLTFLALLFIARMTDVRWWKNEESRNSFVLLFTGALIFLFITLGLAAWNTAANKAAGEVVTTGISPFLIAEMITIGIALVAGILGIISLFRNVGLEKLRQERSFDLLILVGTLILPQLTAFPIKMIGTYTGLGWNPLDYSTTGILRIAAFLIGLTIISAVIGMLWKPRIWLRNFILFYAIFTVFYTTFFTNGFGFFTGIIGSLGYWLDQQGVERGSQPWYYYAFLQVPIYEYLAALGTLLAAYLGIRYNKLVSYPGFLLTQPEIPQQPEIEASETAEEEKPGSTDHTITFSAPLPTLALLIFWGITAVLAYSVAGEKMPWLTVHITLPLLLAAGWGVGCLVEMIPWKKLIENRSWLALVILPVFIASLMGIMGTLVSSVPPFQGNTLDQLQSTSTFIFAVLGFVFSGWGVLYFLHDWQASQMLRIFTVFLFAFLSILTARAAARASYINYDNATEFLVYAHAARGPKDILAQVEEISKRTTGGLDIAVAYDNDALYPYWWYFRDYSKKQWFTNNPTRDLRDAPVIIAGEENWGKLDAITRDNFIVYEYMRLWWPMQDYYNLTWDRIWGTIRDPEMRTAIFKIWLNRDYSDYARLTKNENLTLSTWRPSAKLRMYIRKDIIAKIWNFGAAPALPETTTVDPFLQGMVDLQADQVFGKPGTEPGQFNAPRGIAFAADGSMYVSDSRNHRIQHLTTSGEVLQVWGSFADTAQGQAPGGTFYEPWGIAVDNEGFVYVADTWNHRIQKFTADGQFVKMWGYFGQAENPDGFWGPRDIAIDKQGRLFITDTGNKRIAVFTTDGEFITQFGTAGFELGQFDEQVGLAIDSQDRIYIADTWNQRVQVFGSDPAIPSYIPQLSWELPASWLGESLENKPFIAIDANDHVFVTDPEKFRVLEFDAAGKFIRGWGDYSPGPDGFGLPSGIEVDAEGHVWVSDAGNNVIMRFTLPQP